MKIIYVDMDDVLCDYSGAKKRAIEKNPKVNYPQGHYEFFRKLPPMDGAIEGIKYLLSRRDFDVFILSAPSFKNPLSYLEKRLWVEDYLGFDMVERLILCAYKGLLKGDYLIDDYNCGSGQESFEGQIIHFGQPEFPDWTAVTEFFKTRIL